MEYYNGLFITKNIYNDIFKLKNYNKLKYCEINKTQIKLIVINMSTLTGNWHNYDLLQEFCSQL